MNYPVGSCLFAFKDTPGLRELPLFFENLFTKYFIIELQFLKCFCYLARNVCEIVKFIDKLSITLRSPALELALA